MGEEDLKKYSFVQDPAQRKKMDMSWSIINEKIKASHPNFIEPMIPFTTDQLLKDYNDLYAQIYHGDKLNYA